MFRKLTVAADERGLLFKQGSYDKYLAPGTYWLNRFTDQEVIRLQLTDPFAVPEKPLAVFLQDEELLRDLEVVNVADHEVVLHFVDGRFSSLLPPGQHAFWNKLSTHSFIRTDNRHPEIAPEIDRSVVARIPYYTQSFEVAAYETGILYYNNVLQRELPRADMISGKVRSKLL